MGKHTLSVLVDNKPGVLARVAGLFSRRAFNIHSLAVGPTEHPEISRITVVVDVEDLPLEQVTKQLNKLVHVLKIVELERDRSVQRELLLVKLRCRRAASAPRSCRSSTCSAPTWWTSRRLAHHRGRSARRRSSRRCSARSRRTTSARLSSAAPSRSAAATVPSPSARSTGRPSPRSRDDAGVTRGIVRPLDFTGSRHSRRHSTMAELFYDKDADLVDHPGQEGRRDRLRVAGSRARAEPARLGR